MTTDCDLAIFGSGFGGSILAMVARRLGLRVVLLERGRHPRFAVGESASPLAGILLEQLADRYALPRLRPLASFGSWQRAYPSVACGLKRGFTYYRHQPGERYRRESARGGELLVAASPSDELSDTHWYRADVDHFFVREAIALGTDYRDEVDLTSIAFDGSAAVLEGQRQGRAVRLRAAFVVDATGPRGFLSRALGIRNRGFDAYPATQALFTHFTDVARCDGMADFSAGDGAPDAGASSAGPIPPYPPDDAALHHVFDGGWMWVLRFGNGVASAGVAVTDALARDLSLADGEPAWRRLLARYPSIEQQFARAQTIRPFTWMPALPWRVETAAGERWAMLPSAAAFVDPLFSTGIPLTLMGIERLAAMLAGGGLDPSGLAEYSDVTLAEADHTARYIAGCYAAFPRFDLFTSYSMFYFAAASYSELARRLDAPGKPRRFLCLDRPAFAKASMSLSPAGAPGDVTHDTDAYARAVADAVAPLNVAGLCAPSRRNWYPVEIDDAVRGAAKLGVAAEAVRDCLERLLARTTD